MTVPVPHARLVRRTRWRLALRAALLVTAVLGLLSAAAYVAARGVVFEQLHERLEHAAAAPPPGGSDANRFFYYGGPPNPDDTDGFLVKRDERYGALALLSTPAAGTERWLATSAQDDVAALRAFLIALAALTLIAGVVSLPVGYLLAGQALLPLQQAVQARTEFVALASHRLRTPLAVVRTSTELALAGQGLSPEEALRIVQGQAEHMASLAARLGVLARAEAMGDDPARGALELGSVAAEVTSALRPAAELAGVTLTAWAPSPIWVAGTPDEVTDALVSVVENAIRFTPKGGKAQIEVGAQGRFGVVTVTDNGPGIDRDDLARVTRPFVQGRGARQGSGLGLAIAQAVVQRWGGRLEIHSNVGTGTTVRLLLPSRPAPKPKERGPRPRA